MASDARLSDEILQQGAGLTFVFYEQDGSRNEKSFELGAEDFPEIMPEDGSSIWPLVLNSGKDRFQGSDMPKLYPNRLLINQTDGTPFGCAVVDQYPAPKISCPTLCDMAGVISRLPTSL